MWEFLEMQCAAHSRCLVSVWEWVNADGRHALQECAAWSGTAVKQQCEGWGEWGWRH